MAKDAVVEATKPEEKPEPGYKAYADFSFKLNRRVYIGKTGEKFVPPAELEEIPAQIGQVGIRFQYATYITVTDPKEPTGEREEEMPRYMLLPLKKE